MAPYQLPPTQMALVQTEYAQPLQLKTIPTPEPLPGTAVIQIIHASVVSYAKHVYDGTRKYPYPTPLVPGTNALGRIAALGLDSTSLSIGQLVYLDCVIRSRDDPSHMFLLGLVEGNSDGSRKLMREAWRDGTYAEYCRVPLENVFPLDETRLTGSELGYAHTDLATLGKYLVCYGGLKDIAIQAGETVVVAPATGGFGGAGVAVALSMGASVIAMGRNDAALGRLMNTFGGTGRLKTVKLSSDAEHDAAELRKASTGGFIDAALDISPPMAAKSTHIKSIMIAMRRGGRISLMGGIMGEVLFSFDLIMFKDLMVKGKWMYERKDVLTLIKIVETGVLKIGAHGGIRIDEYGFRDWQMAFDRADENSGWDGFVAMGPQ